MTTVTRYDAADGQAREEGLAAAAVAVRRGRLVVLPTDTVYGVGADAFQPEAVTRLLQAKGRGREMPPPVLVSARTTVQALATGIPDWAMALVEELWPGPLTLVLRQQPSLRWDLGDTRDTVAVRMPDHPVALELLARTGPLAVSSANRTGMPPAVDAASAEEMLGNVVQVVLDAGDTPGPVPSTILDATARDGRTGRVLRPGSLPLERIRDVVAGLDVEIVDEG